MRRFLIFYLIVTALIFIVDFYTFQVVKTVTRDISPTARKVINFLYWSITVVTVATLTVAFFIHFESWPKALRTYLFAGIMILYLSKLFIIPILFLEDAIRGISWLTNMLFTKPSENIAPAAIPRSKFLGQIALMIGGAPLALGIHGMLCNAYNYKIHRVKVSLPNLPDSFAGLKIVQISDIHSGSFLSKDPVKRGVELINKEEPDLVFFTGDIVNYRASEMHDFVDVFKQIKAKEGVFSSLGNHDYADYVRFDSKEEAIKGKQENHEEMIQVHKSMGWQLLLNENRVLTRGDDSLAIIGVENWSAKVGFHSYGDLKKACTGCEHADVKLLLSHDPTHWEGEITGKFKDIDITFSGHTHGAQLGIEIPGYLRWSPAQYIYKHWAGLYNENGQYLYVNRGFGFIGYHGRIGILPEITVMELLKA